MSINYKNSKNFTALINNKRKNFMSTSYKNQKISEPSPSESKGQGTHDS